MTTEPTLAEALRLLDEIEAQVRIVRQLVSLATDHLAQLVQPEGGEPDA